MENGEIASVKTARKRRRSTRARLPGCIVFARVSAKRSRMRVALWQSQIVLQAVTRERSIYLTRQKLILQKPCHFHGCPRKEPSVFRQIYASIFAQRTENGTGVNTQRSTISANETFRRRFVGRGYESWWITGDLSILVRGKDCAVYERGKSEMVPSGREFRWNKRWYRVAASSKGLPFRRPPVQVILLPPQARSCHLCIYVCILCAMHICMIRVHTRKRHIARACTPDPRERRWLTNCQTS